LVNTGSGEPELLVRLGAASGLDELFCGLQPRVRLVGSGADRLRVELFGLRSKRHEIREEDRHDLPLLAGALGNGRQQGAPGGAEASISGVLAATLGTGRTIYFRRSTV
jgi:hypothetical protein